MRIYSDYYEPFLSDNHFTPVADAGRFNPMGRCWALSPEVGKGFYWVYAQNDMFDIKIHDFRFHDDFVMDFRLPECLSVTLYDSISGEETSPYRRLSPGCVKTFVGGREPYRGLIHKQVPIRCIGIEVMPAYYQDYLRKHYPGDYRDPLPAFQKVDQTEDFPAMAMLLREVERFRGDGIAAQLFYEGKVAQAISLLIAREEALRKPGEKRLPDQDRVQLENVTSYLDEHYSDGVTLDRLTKIACMGKTKLKSTFRRVHGCTITEYTQALRMRKAERLLSDTDYSMHRIAGMIGYSTSSRFAELFRRSTGLAPSEYRRMMMESEPQGA